MKIIRIIYSILAILFGAFLIVYGEMDDSPGGQVLGLVLVIFGIVSLIRIRKKNYKYLLIIGLIIAIIGLVAAWPFTKKEAPLVVTNFTECAAAGNAVMESYPRQCRHNGQSFTEDIGNELDKTDLIRLDSPRPGQIIESPLTITGEARGVWFFEASFPVVLTDWDGLIIAQGIAQAQSNWMTNDFVPFQATLTFTVDKNAYSNRGALILRKDNPSGLPEHDDALEIPVLLDKEEFNNINN